jgi:hypothetical protein
VARMVRDHYAKRDGGSLGVIAFSEAQQEAIDQALNEMRREDRELDAVLSSEEGERSCSTTGERAGHERDRIILSVATAGMRRQVRLNLGPLNRDGAERRLNVAITRASFPGHRLLDTPRRTSTCRIAQQGGAAAEAVPGLRRIGRGPQALPSQSARQEEAAPFEEHICKALQARAQVR